MSRSTLKYSAAVGLALWSGILIAASTLAAGPNLPVLGKTLFDAQCAVCHNNGAGPILKGIVGRQIAMTKFGYTPALKAKRGQVWTTEKIAKFIEDPDAFAPGTAMSVSVSDPDDRAAITAYLESLK